MLFLNNRNMFQFIFALFFIFKWYFATFDLIPSSPIGELELVLVVLSWTGLVLLVGSVFWVNGIYWFRTNSAPLVTRFLITFGLNLMYGAVYHILKSKLLANREMHALNGNIFVFFSRTFFIFLTLLVLMATVMDLIFGGIFNLKVHWLTFKARVNTIRCAFLDSRYAFFWGVLVYLVSPVVWLVLTIWSVLMLFWSLIYNWIYLTEEKPQIDEETGAPFLDALDLTYTSTDYLAGLNAKRRKVQKYITGLRKRSNDREQLEKAAVESTGVKK